MDRKYFLDRRSIYNKTLSIQRKTSICEFKYDFLFNKILDGLELGNIFYECGVAHGSSAGFFEAILDDANQQGYKTELHLFDTFNGMPETNPKYDNTHKKGDIVADIEDTQRHVAKFLIDPSFIHYHKGFIPDTFAGLEDHKIVFAHIDVDIYQSYIDCCDFIFPRLIKNGAMIFDDYGHSCCIGAKIAVDEYFGKIKHPIKTVSPLQNYVIK